MDCKPHPCARAVKGTRRRRSTFYGTVRHGQTCANPSCLPSDGWRLPPETNWPPCLRLCCLAPPLEIFPTPLKEASLSFLVSLHTAYVAIPASHKLRDHKQPALFTRRTHSNRLNAHTPPASGPPPPAHRAGNSHASDPRTPELAVGAHIHGRSTPVAQSIALAGRTRHTHLFGTAPRF